MGTCCSKEPLYEVVSEDRDEKQYVRDGEDDDENIADDGAIVRLQGPSAFTSMFTKQGKKGINQDAMTVWENLAGEDMFFCGVFDGHGPLGHKIARYARDTLPSKLHSAIKRSQISDASAGQNNFVNGSTDKDGNDGENFFFNSMKASLIKSFSETDDELSLDSAIDSFCSGTTAVTVIKKGDHLVVANLGDSRAVLCTRSSKNQLIPIQLTVDLKPNVPSEAERINICKGRIFALDEEPDVYRIWMPEDDCPGLAMARAFGDFCLKDYGLISCPEISHRKLTANDEFVVLATDGIWDVMSNQEVIKIVSSVKDRSTAAKTLVSFAVRTWRSKFPCSRIDDCAVICLFFKEETVASKSTSDVNGGSSVSRAEFSVHRKSKSVKSEDNFERESKGSDGVSTINSFIKIPRISHVF
ncbi:probable protein phosphatase 2C 65 [Carica papaya]|uniref:probable protein phosphatase 2C 65 n=1 Tax=Carica papaya TaxID=3649 RepID=UPI000B8CDE63|nr:probable protein phosphatase 2C 65 [Carica papaya]